MKAVRVFALGMTFALLTLARPCHASLFSDAMGIATDPLKLAQGSQKAYDAVIQCQNLMADLDRMEIRTNSDISDRLRQVKEISDSIVAAVDKKLPVLQSMVDQVVALETDIFNRAESLIEQANCLVVNAMSALDTELKQAALTIKQVHPAVTLFGFTIIDVKTQAVTISDPFEAYTAVAAFHIDQIRALSPTSPAREFPHHFAEIVRLGRNAQCAYRGQPLALWIERNYIVPYVNFERDWTTIVNPI